MTVPEPAAPAGVSVSPKTLPPRTWPFLIAMASVAGLAELAYAVVNVSTIPVYVKFGLGLPKLVGFAITAFLLSEAVLNSPMGSLADRFGRRRLMVIGPLISVFTCIATALLRVPSGGHLGTWLGIGALVGLRLLDGAGAAMLWPAVFAAIGDRIDEKRQAAAMSVLNVTYMIGLAFGPLIGGMLNDDIGDAYRFAETNPWRYAPSLFAASFCFLVASIVAFVVAPRRAEQHERMRAAGADPHAATVSLAGLKAALRRVPMMLVLVFVIFLGIGLISPNVKLYAMERFHISESYFGRLLLIPALLIAALSVPIGRLGDIWGKARSIQLGVALCAVSLWAILRLETEWSLVVLGSLAGIGFVLAFPAYMALLSDIAGPVERGGIIGAVRTAQGVGMLLGAGFASFLYERWHLLPFVVASVLLTFGFFISLVSIRERPAAQQ